MPVHLTAQSLSPLLQTREERKTTNHTDQTYPSENDELHFMSLMKDAITNTSTDRLWKKYAKRYTMQFKQYGLESKVIWLLVLLWCKLECMFSYSLQGRSSGIFSIFLLVSFWYNVCFIPLKSQFYHTQEYQLTFASYSALHSSFCWQSFLLLTKQRWYIDNLYVGVCLVSFVFQCGQFSISILFFILP